MPTVGQVPTSDACKGVIIEESLQDKRALEQVIIKETRVSRVTESHQTPWLAQWTLHTIEMPAERADSVAFLVSSSLDPDHGGSWYADFRSDKFHFVVFRGKVFKIDVHRKKRYEEVRRYDRSLGIPERQLDFTPPG